MPKTAEVVDFDGANLGEVQKVVAEAAKQMIELQADRSAINAEMTAIRKKVAAKGITPRAFSRSLAYQRMEPDQRAGDDISYALCREWLGLPLEQGELKLPTPSSGAGEPPPDSANADA